MYLRLIHRLRFHPINLRHLPQSRASISPVFTRRDISTVNKMDVEITSPTPSQVRVLAHHQYVTAEHITPTTLDPSPLTQFHHWFTAASSANVQEPEAMTLSTVDPTTMTPSSRVVLFKELDETGFVFYTNYTSRKSRELDGCGRAALCFYWREVHRQVRVVGRVEKVDKATSEAYFNGRPLGSRLGAWASKQSTVIQEGEVEKRLEDVKAKFARSEDVPLPEFWGGWRIVPDEVEFWCGKPSRLHDRVRYMRREDEKTGWKVERLSP